jgi:bifunctional non-homologous end joining protein LigD
MLATSAGTLAAGDDWTYEVKWDGYRTMALKERGRVTLFSRNLKDATDQYSAVARSAAELPCRRRPR